MFRAIKRVIAGWHFVVAQVDMFHKNYKLQIHLSLALIALFISIAGLGGCAPTPTATPTPADTGSQLRIDDISVPRTATIVVAAFNSSAKSKAQADYVCDGTDDQVEIQAAIDGLPASGGKVLLMEGKYNLSKASDSPYQHSIHIAKSGVEFECLGELYLTNNQNATLILVGYLTEPLHDIRVKVAKLDGNRANQTDYAFGVYVKNAIGAKVEGNFYSIYGSAVNFEDCSYSALDIYSEDVNCHNAFLRTSMFSEARVRAKDSVAPIVGIVGGGYNRVVAVGNTIGSRGIGVRKPEDFGWTGDTYGYNIIEYTGYGSGIGQAVLITAVHRNDIRVNVSGYHTGVKIDEGGYQNTIRGNINNVSTGVHLKGAVQTLVEVHLARIKQHGILVEGGGYGNQIVNSVIWGTSTAANHDFHGIYIDVPDCVVKNSKIARSWSGNTQDKEVYLGSNAQRCDIVDNEFGSPAFTTLGTDGVSDNGSENRIKHNRGWVTESSGSATITGDGSTTSFDIAHGMNVTPNVVIVTPTNNNTASATDWVSGKDEVNFTITFDTAPGSGLTLTFDWEVQMDSN